MQGQPVNYNDYLEMLRKVKRLYGRSPTIVEFASIISYDRKIKLETAKQYLHSMGELGLIWFDVLKVKERGEN